MMSINEWLSQFTTFQNWLLVAYLALLVMTIIAFYVMEWKYQGIKFELKARDGYYDKHNKKTNKDGIPKV